VFAVLLALCNGPVLTGSASSALVFFPAAVQAGEWWRLFTHLWVHVTWYHLLLDGTAFLMLYQSLVERRLLRRISYVFASGAGGLLVSWWAAPAIGSSGLCGLSGVAHGLMAVSAIELMAGRSLASPAARLGLLTFVLVVGKAMVETISGRMFFTFLHFGLMGDPVAVSHAGGVLGGLLALLGTARLELSRASCGLKSAFRASSHAVPNRLFNLKDAWLATRGAAKCPRLKENIAFLACANNLPFWYVIGAKRKSHFPAPQTCEKACKH